MKTTPRLVFSKSTLFLILTIVHIALLSFLILPYYIKGDQEYYRAFYSALDGMSLLNGLKYYRFSLSSEEPIYFLLSWFLSNNQVDKDLFISISNIILAVGSYKVLINLGSRPFIAYLITSYNFYFLVFYFAAERLKFALIFFSLFVLVKKWRFLYALLSVLSHSQILILYVTFFATHFKSFFYDTFIRLKLPYRYLWLFIIVISISSIMLSLLSGHISNKIESYISYDRSLTEIMKALAFFGMSIYYSKNKIDPIYSFVPLIILVLLLGGERINFIGYLLFLYYSIHYRGGLNIGVVITNAYFIFTGINFLYKVVDQGTGF